MKPQPIPPKLPEVYCNCPETFLHGRRVPQPQYHSCHYIFEQKARADTVNKRCEAAVLRKMGEPPPFIPVEARKKADQKAVDARTKWMNTFARSFNFMFTKEMEKPANLISFSNERTSFPN